MTKPPVKRLRCAVYTRKSSEEGLDQSFNSLHAQREACEAYVKSQAGEGWIAQREAYDDGGFSGGSMERPALKRLLAAVEAGQIDVVVVYKVDRLTRSLMDFAKIVEAFDRRGVSFVSVTQAFNTTTSMGRLTLNVLLSFAQFEREVTGERIRDKIAASKAKGMWMGGNLPLGYDPPSDRANRSLVVNEAEADTVRTIFRRYLELGSVHALARWLDEEGVRSKRRVSSSGRAIGGARLSRGALFHLLKNRTYLGEIVHRERSYPGSHTPIVDEAVFGQVQALLASQTRRRSSAQRGLAMPLRGLIFDADGTPMSPTFTHGSKGQVYRYYVSAPLQQGAAKRGGEDALRRVPAGVAEELVARYMAALNGGEPPPVRALARVEIHPTTVQILIRRSAFFSRRGDADAQLQALARRAAADARLAQEPDGELVRLTVECRLKFRGGRVELLGASGAPFIGRTRRDAAMIKALRSAHRLLAQANDVPAASPFAGLPHSAPKDPYERNLLPLAFLAPDLQTQILEGRQPLGLTLQQLITADIAPAWVDQRRWFASFS